MVSSLLSEAHARDVEAAVARVEEKTAAEVVVAVVPRSDDYVFARGVLSVAWAFATGAFCLHFFPGHPPEVAVGAQLVVLGVTYALSSLPALGRFIVPSAQIEKRVQARAFQLFAERGLHRTQSRSGVLVFVSEFEHRVVVLGDSGIDKVVGAQGWAAQVSRLLVRIRERRARDGLIELLEELEPKLSQVSPLGSAENDNELPNDIVRG